MGGKPTYKDSPLEDREELLASSSDSASSTNDEMEKPWSGYNQRKARCSGFLEVLQQYWWLIAIGLMSLIVLLQLAIWDAIASRPTGNSCAVQQVGGDYLRKEPTFSTEVRKWNADPEFTPLNASEFLDPKVQAKWETLFPAGAGFIGPDATVYNSTSVTHQLHCVYIMGKIFSAVLTHSPNLPEPNDYEAHFLHCVDYMRQAAMCAGDLAIEPRGENGQPAMVNLENAFNGFHVCKSYNQVKNYLEGQVKDGLRNILPLDD